MRNKTYNKPYNKKQIYGPPSINKKKAYFYSLDALIAGIIIAVGVFIILHSQSRQAPKQNVYLLSEDLTNYLSHTKIYDLNDDLYNDSIKIWKQQGNITHIDNTILEQAAEFYAKGQLNLAQYLISNVTVSSVAAKYNFRFSIEGTNIFEFSKVTARNATSMISTKSIVAGTLDNSNFFGPYKAEILVWQ